MTLSTLPAALDEAREDTARILETVFGLPVRQRYMDFCRLCDGKTGLYTASPLAAHAFRELESVLRTSLRPPEALANGGAPEIRAARSALEALKMFDGDAIARALKGLVPRNAHNKEIDLIVSLLGLSSEVARMWKSVRRGLTDIVHERSHHRTLSAQTEALQARQREADYVLREIAVATQRHFATLIQRVDALAAMVNVQDAVKRFKVEIPGALPLQWRFFQMIEGSSWLRALIDRGVLVDPPVQLASAGPSSIHPNMRPWPVGAYLRRLAASENPADRKLVAEAIDLVSCSQDPDVRYWIFEVLAALPADEAEAFVDQAVGWIDSNTAGLHDPVIVTFLHRLLQGGTAQAALQVAQSLFRLRAFDGGVEGRHGRYLYEHHLLEAAPLMAGAAGVAAVELLASLLATALDLGGHFREAEDFDYSSHVVDDFDQDSLWNGQILNALVFATRKTALSVIESDETSLGDILAILLRCPARLVRRLAMYLIAKVPGVHVAESSPFLTDLELIDGVWGRGEYVTLAQAQFSHLDSPAQAFIFARIDSAPTRFEAGWREFFKSQHDREPTALELEGFRDQATLEVCWAWRAVLPASRRAAVEAIASVRGDPDAWRKQPGLAEEPANEDWTALSVGDACALVDALPMLTGNSPSTRAKAFAFERAIETDPIRYCAAHERLSLLPLEWLARALEALNRAVAASKDLVWDAVLDLTGVALRRSAASENTTHAVLLTAIASLLRQGLLDGGMRLSFEHATTIGEQLNCLAARAVALPLADDALADYAKSPLGTAQRALRGVATTACVVFAAWNRDRLMAADVEVSDAIDAAPNMSRALDVLLAADAHANPLVRVIMAPQLPWLSHAAPLWTARHVTPAIISEQFGEWSWQTFLEHCWGAPLLWPLLESRYSEEIERLAHDHPEPTGRQKGLARHLLRLVLGGVAGHNHPILVRFAALASDALRAHMIGMLGQQLGLPDMPADDAARGFAYWDSRFNAAKGEASVANFRAELGTIGRWVVQALPGQEEWLLSRMEALLQFGIAPTGSFALIDWLGRQSAERLGPVLRVVRLLVRDAKVPTGEYMHREGALRSIIGAGLASLDPADAERAREIANVLASKGQVVYLELLKLHSARG